MSPAVAVLLLAVAVLLALPAAVPSRRVHRVARGSAPGPRQAPRRGSVAPVPARRRTVGRPIPVAVPVPVPMVLDLVAEVVASGVPPLRALAVVAECLDAAPGTGDARTVAELTLLAGLSGTGASQGPSAPPGPSTSTTARAGPDGQGGLPALAAALELAVITGAGPVGLIRAAAEDERGRRQAERLRAARRLGVSLLLPTGLCLLPAFVVLTVVPFALDLVLG